MISSEKKLEIITKLNKALKVNSQPLSCPMCGNKSFTISDGYTIQVLQDFIDKVQLGGPSIPCVCIICRNCGFVSQHALGALGLVPEKSEDK